MTSATPLPRRGLFKAGLAASAAVVVPASAAAASAAPAGGPGEPRRAEAELRDLERRYAARLGVYGRTPLVLTVLSSKSARDAPVDNALIADAARVLARALAPGE
ncbi:hypothetical protein ACF1A5_10765 [Streptomyces sp. NPDC014864]|uniref:hypothetical protein n=1 Tax=Streptomyces sp. NPDC014864 TaxID=3364924 RepID=UPI0036F6432D